MPASFCSQPRSPPALLPPALAARIRRPSPGPPVARKEPRVTQINGDAPAYDYAFVLREIGSPE
jgi:hypothetical protein